MLNFVFLQKGLDRILRCTKIQVQAQPQIKQSVPLLLLQNQMFAIYLLAVNSESQTEDPSRYEGLHTMNEVLHEESKTYACLHNAHEKQRQS